MANTPLELYESAYQLQHYDKKIPDAIRIYEAIIRDFPDSNECGYAVIQLQKIKSRNITKALTSGSAKGYPLLIIAFTCSLMALIAAACAIFFLFNQLRQEHQRTTLAVSAVGKMFSGNEEGALKVLDELSADIFRKHNLAPQTPPLTPPPAMPPISGRIRKVAAPAGEPQTDDAAAGKKYAKPLQQKPATPKRTGPLAKPNPKKSPLIVNPDSISYF